MNWPDDADGDVLRRLETDGFDFEKECEIDFNIDFKDWPLPTPTIEALKKLYPNSQVIDPDQEDLKKLDLAGYAQFQIAGKLTYDLVVSTQKEVTEQMKPFGGRCESWGVMHG